MWVSSLGRVEHQSNEGSICFMGRKTIIVKEKGGGDDAFVRRLCLPLLHQAHLSDHIPKKVREKVTHPLLKFNNSYIIFLRV